MSLLEEYTGDSLQESTKKSIPDESVRRVYKQKYIRNSNLE